MGGDMSKFRQVQAIRAMVNEDNIAKRQEDKNIAALDNNSFNKSNMTNFEEVVILEEYDSKKITIAELKQRLQTSN